jgi:hypothetical protein
MNAEQLLTLACLVRSDSISPDQYIQWCDAEIRRLDSPPSWILALTVEQDKIAAADLLLDEANYVMTGRWHILETSHLQVAFMLLLHRSGATSWEGFLNGAINASRNKPSAWPVGDLERLLNAYIANDRSESVELHQAAHLAEVFAEEVGEIMSLDSVFPLRQLFPMAP